jgi:hypothetical protein
MPACATNMVALPFASSSPTDLFARSAGEREHFARCGRHVAEHRFDPHALESAQAKQTSEQAQRA